MQVALRDIRKKAEELLLSLKGEKGAVVLALSGSLGSGKTTFVQALADVLGVGERVISPTFLLMRRYGTRDSRFTTLVHVDAYRAEDPHELQILRLGDVIKEEGVLLCVEWPERLGSLMPTPSRSITFKVLDENTRNISL